MKTKGSDHTNPHNAVDAISAPHVLHQHRHFDHPEEVVSARLSNDEKRAILASWASDLHAVESLPELRHPPGVPHPVRYRDILDALKKLDEWRDEDSQTRPARRRISKRRPDMNTRQTQPRGPTATRDPVPQRLLAISRYVENFRRLARLADRIGRSELGTAMMEVAGCMERLSNDIAVSATGAVILRRAARLVGTVEGLLERQAKLSVLH
nr:hypothetical protein [Rhizobium sp. WYCCWR 11152]